MKIKLYKWGIASRQGDTIWINNKLKKQDPLLYKAILQHEKYHSSGLTWNDVWLDLSNESIKPLKKRYYQFILSNPRSWIEFLPFWFYEGRLVINPMILGLYVITGLMIWGLKWMIG